MIFFGILFFAVVIAAGAMYFGAEAKKSLIRQCSYGNVEIYNLLMNAKDYSPLKELMAKVEAHEDRYFVSLGISRLFPVEYLEDWLNNEPKSADALLCFGARMVQLSWDARGHGRGYEVSDEKWADFFKKLEKTKDILNRCAEANPNDPTPWAYLIMVSTWHSDDLDTRYHYFEQAIARDKNNWPAHLHMIIALSEKWGGDNEEMVLFAQEIVTTADEGSDLPVILIKAYIEYWKYLYLFEDKLEQAELFINSEEIQSQAVAAYNKSLGSKLHCDTSTSIFARYNASSWFWTVKDKALLKKELDYLGNKIEDIHWSWAGSEGELEEARDFAK